MVGMFTLACSLSVGCNAPDESIPSISPASSGTTGEDDTSTASLEAQDHLDATDPDADSEVESGVEETATVTVSLASYDEVLAAVEQLKGRIVVLDIWSTSCLPCMKEFPHLVELSHKAPGQLACISLNVDYIGLKNQPATSYVSKVKGFLVKKKATFTNFVSSEPDTELLKKFEADTIPGIVLFDRSGKRLKTYTDSNSGEDGLSYKGDIIPRIEELLKQDAP